MVDTTGDNLAGAVARAAAHWQMLKPANPPAGQGATIAPPSQYLYRIIAGQFTVTNTATTAVGMPVLLYLDGDGTPFFQQTTGANLGASSAVTVNFGLGIGINSPANAIAVPDIELPPGFSVALGLTSGNASMVVSAVRVLIQRIPFGDGGRSMSGLPPAEVS